MNIKEYIKNTTSLYFRPITNPKWCIEDWKEEFKNIVKSIKQTYKDLVDVLINSQ